MLLTSPLNKRPIYRLRPGTTLDSYGDPVESWDNPDRLLLKNAEIQQRAASDAESETPTADVIRGARTLFIPGAADIHEHDRIQDGAEIWRVDGTPIVRQGLAMRSYTTAYLVRASSS